MNFNVVVVVVVVAAVVVDISFCSKANVLLFSSVRLLMLLLLLLLILRVFGVCVVCVCVYASFELARSFIHLFIRTLVCPSVFCCWWCYCCFIITCSKFFSFFRFWFRLYDPRENYTQKKRNTYIKNIYKRCKWKWKSQMCNESINVRAV